MQRVKVTCSLPMHHETPYSFPMPGDGWLVGKAIEVVPLSGARCAAGGQVYEIKTVVDAGTLEELFGHGYDPGPDKALCVCIHEIQFFKEMVQ